MKNPAPPPPGPPQPTPRRLPRNIVPDGGVAMSGDIIKENVLQPHVELQLSLPSGAHTTSTYDGRKALMDLLVEVCGQYHLNPAYHTLELLSSEGQPVAFKPNAFLGSLDVACALIKERVVDEKLVRKPVPRVPEKSVRLVVNYHRSQKTVVRVSPLVPLHALVPVICQRCEFDPAHVLLLRDSVSRHELDLDKSLSDLEIRELYALDQSLVLQPKMASAPALNYAESTCSTQSAGTAEKKGLLGFFKFNRRKSKALSGVSTSLEARPSTLGQSQSVMNISKMSPKVELKKRRAPAPPPNTAQSYSSLGMHAGCPSTSSLLKKRKAPAPPPTPASHSPTPTPTPTPPTHSSPAHVPKATPPPTSSSAQATVAVAAAAASAAAVTTATVALPAATASRRVAAVSRQDDTASEASGASEESERNVALCSSSSSQADSDVPSSHLDEVAVSSQDEEYEEEEYEEVEEEEEEEEELELEVDEMEMELAVLQQLQQRSRQQMSQPVVVERLQHRQQPALLHTQASEPRPQTQIQPQTPQTQTQTQIQTPQTPQPQPPQQPQGPKQQEQQQVEEHLDSDRSTTSAETGSTVSLRMDDTENNRHSGIDAGRQVPVKPRRTSLGDQTSRAASASPALIDRNSHNASPDSFTDMPQHSWLHSSRPAEGAEVPVDCVETGSVSSSSGSFADQGYAEDPCPLSSPADRTPPRAPRDLSSDSDEGCATWNSSTSQDLYQKGQSGKIKDSYEEDPKLMAQLQLTLADLDAELAEMNQSSESPSEADDVIPVSVVDLVPVTTIDEVSDTQLSNGQNKNNNATLCPEPAVQPRASAEVRGSRSTQEVKQSAAEVKRPATEVKRPAAEVKRPTADSKDKTLKSEPSLRESKAVASATGTKPPPAKSSAVAAPSKAQPVGGSQSDRAPPRAQEVPVERSKITQVPASRFGTKTFTIVPTKVAVPSSLQTQGSLTNGAIKIDERGNMVKGHGVRQCVGTAVAEAEKEEAEPQREKTTLCAIKIDERGNMVRGHSVRQCVGTAVAQAEKEEAEPQREKTTLGAIKIDERGNMVRGHGVRQCVGTAVAQAEKEKAKTLWTSTDKQDAPTATKTTTTTTTKTILTPQPAPGGAQAKPVSSVVSGINHSSTANGREAPQGQESRPPSSEPAGPAQRATPSAQDPRDLSFLKPQRRTSSQYMASAISNKFTVRSAVRAEGIQEKPEPAPPAQKPSTEARPATTTTSISSVTVKGSSGSSQVVVSKENGSVPGWTALKGPQAYRSHTFNKQSSVEPPRALKGGAATASDVDSVAVNGKTKLTTHVAANRSNATPAQPDQNPEPWAAPGVLPEPNQVSLFGPVKKFRPVIQKSVEKDTSLHSSLMQAIQSGDSKERLKKVCEASAGSGMKKPALQEEESTQSALLSALRADNSNRLKQTKSKAANELERFRATESASASQNQSSSLQHTSPPSAPAAAPPPPPPPTAAPPPPRAVLASAGNPEQTREALLDAIRSGAGAKGLKRVPVATKTVMVNGRLGTMTASCSLSQGL